MEMLNSAFRGIARAFAPSNSVVNQASNDQNQASVIWNSGLISDFPELGKDYTGSTLFILNGIKTVPAAVRCVEVKTDITTGLPKETYTKDVFPEKREGHWANVLMENPSPVMSKDTFERYIYSNVFSLGEQFVIIERDASGFAKYFTPAKFVSYEFSGMDNNPYVHLTTPDMFMFSNGLTSTRIQNRKVLLSDVIHLTDGTYDPFNGRAKRPMMQKGRNPVGLYLAVLKRYEASLFLGGHARNYLQTSMNQWKEFQSMLKTEGFSGIFGASKTVPIPFGSQLIEAGRSHAESQTLEMLQFLIGEIARAWGVPLFMLYSDVQSGSSGKASRPDLAEQFINFVRSGFGTAVKSFESEFNKKLFGVNRNIMIRFDLDSLTSGTMQQKAALAKDMVDAGIWTVNEGREYTNKAPMDGGNVLRSPRGGSSDNQPIGDNNTNEDEPENLFKHSRFEEISANAYINAM